MEYYFHHIEGHEHEHTHTHEHSHEHGGMMHSHPHSHIHTHEHDHTHSEGHDHDHEHDHALDGAHDHQHCDESQCKTCGHGCANATATPADKTVALLTYMVEHNRHHVMELEQLAESINGAAAEKIAAAIETFCAANEQLADALRAVKDNQ